MTGFYMRAELVFNGLNMQKIVIQNGKLFIDLLNKIQVRNIVGDVKNLLKARSIREYDENYPKDALLMYAENEPGMKRNEAWSTLHNRG